jgi:hypothetical protein
MFPFSYNLNTLITSNRAVRIVGETSNDLAGVSLTAIPDMNSDGAFEVGIGANGYSAGNNQGADYIVSGASINAALGGTIALGTTTSARVLVGATNEYNGNSISYISDLTGDNVPELITGANGYPAASNQGTTYVVSGGSVSSLTGNYPFTSPTAGVVIQINGESANDFSSYPISTIADLNADTIPEVLIGANGFSAGTNQGALYVVSGARIKANLAAGTNVLLSNYGTAGAGIFRLTGEAAGDKFGGAVSTIKDLDGDGKPELVVGAVDYTSAVNKGFTYIISSSKIDLANGGSLTVTPAAGIYRLDGENTGDVTGYAVSAIGDLNADGKEEVVIGSYGYPAAANTGATYIVSGGSINLAAGGSRTLGIGSGTVRLVGENPNDQAGSALSILGDLNADGKPELLIGASGTATGGATYIVSGASIDLTTGGSTPLAPINGIGRIDAETAGDLAGYAVGSLADINADGKPEILIGAPAYLGGAYTGATYVISGIALVPSPSPSQSPSVSPSNSPSASPSISPSTSPSPSISASPSQSPSSSPSPSVSLSPSLSPSPSPSPSVSPSPSGLSSKVVSSSAAASPSESKSVVASALQSSTANPASAQIASQELTSTTAAQTTQTSKTTQTKTVKTTTTQGLPSKTGSQTVKVSASAKAPANEPAMFFQQGGHQHRIGHLDSELGKLQVRDIEDDSASFRTEPLWMEMPMLHAAQLPLAQTGMHLMQQGYNRVMDWFQGKGSDEGIQIQELLPREQVGSFLQAYNKVSQELEGVIQQLEADSNIAGTMLDWLKESVIEHRVQGQKFIQQQMVGQEAVKSYFGNLQAVAKDLTEFVEDLSETHEGVSLAYVQSRLTGINQELVTLSQDSVVVVKDQTTLRANVKAQMQANALQQQPMNILPQTANVNTQLTADVIGLLV